MFSSFSRSGLLALVLLVPLVVSACGTDPTPLPTATATPTVAVTPDAPEAPAVPTPTLVPTSMPTPAPTATPVPPTPTPTTPPQPGVPTEIVLTPVQDGSIWESQGNTASGAGPGLFAGNTNAGSARRALIKFDVASAIPPGASIVSASLGIVIDRSPRGGGSPATFDLYPLAAEWTTAGSIAPGQGGSGGIAEDGDVTWTHRSRGNTRWATDGGDFVADSRGATSSGTWETNDTLVGDVQSWLDAPESNFGWIIVGAEEERQTARRFSSSEGVNPPTLTLVFVPSE